ncbi:MAG: 23S rRNA (guanosine(2251)-2'-O)-methyltransferase RlmB [Chlamydiota bacterium]
MNNPHTRPRGIPSKDQLIMGVHAIQELMAHAPDRLVRIFTVHPKGPRKADLLTLCEKKGIPISFVRLDELTQMAGSDSHQSFVAQIKERDFQDVKDFIRQTEEKESVFVLMLDEIFDPQNFGALIRSAECFGLDAVAWSKNRGCDLTPMVAKASSGASEILPLIRISNLADSVEKFKEAGFEVVAALLNPNSESAFSFAYAQKTVLIVGSEGEGIQPLLQKKADRSIYLPMKGKIQSLNVAQATAALLALWAAFKK